MNVTNFLPFCQHFFFFTTIILSEKNMNNIPTFSKPSLIFTYLTLCDLLYTFNHIFCKPFQLYLINLYLTLISTTFSSVDWENDCLYSVFCYISFFSHANPHNLCILFFTAYPPYCNHSLLLPFHS